MSNFHRIMQRGGQTCATVADYSPRDRGLYMATKKETEKEKLRRKLKRKATKKKRKKPS